MLLSREYLSLNCVAANGACRVTVFQGNIVIYVIYLQPGNFDNEIMGIWSTDLITDLGSSNALPIMPSA